MLNVLVFLFHGVSKHNVINQVILCFGSKQVLQTLHIEADTVI